MAKKVFKIALDGYDAQTDTDPNHFSLYVDQNVDYVLIKEKVRGTKTIAANGSGNEVHGLAYIPFALVYVRNSDGSYTKCFGQGAASASSRPGYSLDTDKLYFYNPTAAAVTFSYYIFHDNLTTA